MKKIHSLTLFSAVALAVAGCSNSNQKKADSSDSTATAAATGATIEPLTNSAPGADKINFFLRIVDDVKTDSSHIYTTQALFNQDTVGAKFEVVDFIPAGIIDDQPSDDMGFTKGKIKILSTGKQSDNLVKALGELFNTPTSDGFTTEPVVPNVFSSNKVNADLSKKSTYSFKLFLDNKQAEPAELFLNVDTYKQAIEFSEKDASFRKGLLSAFTGK